MKKEDLERDVFSINECMTCALFEPFQRRVNDQRAALYDQLKNGDASDVLKMKVTQACLDLVEKILETPAKLEAEIARVVQMKERIPERVPKMSRVQRQKELLV